MVIVTDDGDIPETLLCIERTPVRRLRQPRASTLYVLALYVVASADLAHSRTTR